MPLLIPVLVGLVLTEPKDLGPGLLTCCGSLKLCGDQSLRSIAMTGILACLSFVICAPELACDDVSYELLIWA